MDDSDDDILLVSDVYTICILDYKLTFNLRVKTDSYNSETAIMLSLHHVSDDIHKKQAATVQYTMFCEETQCEYRQMCVIDDTDGSGWFDDYLTVSELKQLN